VVSGRGSTVAGTERGGYYGDGGVAGADPRATLREIETALDERLARVRARMLQDTALASAATDVSQLPEQERALRRVRARPGGARPGGAHAAHHV
jgi:hypothetical protein